MTKWKPVDPEAAFRLFRRLREAHPHLEAAIDPSPENVDVEMLIPAQAGLPFDVVLNLQGDEYHLCAGEHFRLEWFPGHDPDVAEQYRNAVDGLLSGRCRIIEHQRFGRVVKSQLQTQVDGRWKVLGTCRTLDALVPWPTTKRILRTG
jgi:hypothetical protein